MEQRSCWLNQVDRSLSTSSPGRVVRIVRHVRHDAVRRRIGGREQQDVQIAVEAGQRCNDAAIIAVEAVVELAGRGSRSPSKTMIATAMPIAGRITSPSASIGG